MRLYPFFLLLGFSFSALLTPAPADAANLLKAADSKALQTIAFISNGNDFIKNWHAAPSNRPPYIKAVKTVKAGDALTAGFIASGMQADAKGNYLVVFDVTIINPKGQVVAEQLNYAKAAGAIGNASAFALADPALSFGFSPNDPKGKYTLEVTAKDQVTAKKSATSYTFTLQ